MDSRKITAIRARVFAYALDLIRSNGIDPELAVLVMESVLGEFRSAAHEILIDSLVEREADKLDKVEQVKEALNADINESN